MKRNRFIIIGLGTIGKELLKRLSKEYDITCIDLNPDTEEGARQLRPDIGFIHGDATSRLVLEKAGVAKADAVIIVTTDEQVNLETARILKEYFKSRRVLAIGTTNAGVESLEALGAEVENMLTASAIVIRNRLELSSRAVHAIGLGKEEILEVEVHPHSRLANRPVRTLTPIRWRIGIIYRDGNIIVPKRDTLLKPKDRIVILGEPGVLKTVSEVLTFRFQQFPLEYGSTAIAYLTGKEAPGFFDEIDYLFSVFSLHRLIFIFSKQASRTQEQLMEYTRKENLKKVEIVETDLGAFDAIQHSVSEMKGDHGLILLSHEMIRNSLFGSQRKGFLLSLIQEVRCPVLLSAGTFPYEKAAVPCIEQVNIQNILETALEISGLLSNEVSALLMNPSKYISTDDDMQRHEAMKKTIHEVSAMYKVSVDRKILEGNPVKSIIPALKEFNLLITDTQGWKHQRWLPSFLSPDVSWNIVRSSEISTLVLPQVEEIL